MDTTYQKMEHCLSTTDSVPLIDYLSDGDWRVRYAAAVRLGDVGDSSAVAPLLAVLAQEDVAPLYSQPDIETGAPAGKPGALEALFPAGTTPDDIEAFRRRGRLKQAVCLALGNIGVADTGALTTLSRYATDSGQDYTVRAAACKALGQLASPEVVPALQLASGDEEWCTRTEALKALKSLVG